jgi:uncharacterized protein
MLLQGTVSNVAQFGAFIDLGVHQDGLVHVSQLANKFVSDAREVVKTGDVVKVRVVEVDLQRQRISADDETRRAGSARRWRQQLPGGWPRSAHAGARASSGTGRRRDGGGLRQAAESGDACAAGLRRPAIAGSQALAEDFARLARPAASTPRRCSDYNRRCRTQQEQERHDGL